MKVEFDITITDKDMADYKFFHKYTSFSGWCELLLGAITLILGIYALMHLDTMNVTFALLALLFGIVFLAVIPVQLIMNSRKAVSREAFQRPMHYVLDEDKITVSMGEDNASVAWQQVYRVKDTGKSILIYFTPTRANIIPKRELEDKLQDVRTIIINGVGSYRAKIHE